MKSATLQGSKLNPSQMTQQSKIGKESTKSGSQITKVTQNTKKPAADEFFQEASFAKEMPYDSKVHITPLNQKSVSHPRYNFTDAGDTAGFARNNGSESNQFEKYVDSKNDDIANSLNSPIDTELSK